MIQEIKKTCNIDETSIKKAHLALILNKSRKKDYIATRANLSYKQMNLSLLH